MNGKSFAAAQPRPRRRTAWVMLFIIVLVAFSYAGVLFVGGKALVNAPLARPILRLKKSLEAFTRFEPGHRFALPPLVAAAGPKPSPRVIGLRVTPAPSPGVTSVPSPASSPVFVAAPPEAPSVITFTIEYENTTGVRLTGVRIVDRIPAGTTYRLGSASPTASFDGNQLVWDLGTLDPGERGTVSFVVTSRSARVTNRAVMTSNEAPPGQVESSATVS